MYHTELGEDSATGKSRDIINNVEKEVSSKITFTVHRKVSFPSCNTAYIY